MHTNIAFADLTSGGAGKVGSRVHTGDPLDRIDASVRENALMGPFPATFPLQPRIDAELPAEVPARAGPRRTLQTLSSITLCLTWTGDGDPYERQLI
jgi:hypothetical protein